MFQLAVLYVVVVLLLASLNCGVQSQRLVGAASTIQVGKVEGKNTVNHDLNQMRAALEESIEIDFSIYDSNDEFYVTILSEDGYTLCEGKISRDQSSTNLACQGVDESILRYGDNLFFVTIYSLKKKEIYSQKTKHFYYYPTPSMASYRRRSVGLKLSAISNRMVQLMKFGITRPIIVGMNALLSLKTGAITFVSSIGTIPVRLFKQFSDAITLLFTPCLSRLGDASHALVSKILQTLNPRRFCGKEICDDKRNICGQLLTFFGNKREFWAKSPPRLWSNKHKILMTTLMGIFIIAIVLAQNHSKDSALFIETPSSLGPPPSLPPPQNFKPSATSQLQTPKLHQDHDERKVNFPTFPANWKFHSTNPFNSSRLSSGSLRSTNQNVKSVFHGWYQLVHNKTPSLQHLTMTVGSVLLLLMHSKSSETTIECVASYDSGGRQKTITNIMIPKLDEARSQELNLDEKDNSVLAKRLIVGTLAIAAQSLIGMVSGKSINGFSF
jgi:hypothetical protein